MCRQANELRAYGAGLLSSFGELEVSRAKSGGGLRWEYCLSGKPEMRDFDPFVTSKQAYPITEYQPVYFVVNSFSVCPIRGGGLLTAQEMKAQLRDFAATLKRPFSVRYNPYRQKIETTDKLLPSA